MCCWTSPCSAALKAIRCCAPPSCCSRNGCPRPAPDLSPRCGSRGHAPGFDHRRRDAAHLLDPGGAAPEVHLLSNGHYHVVITNAGGGYSRWRNLAVTRWREDPTRDCWGTFCYLRDLDSGALWSTAWQPTLRPGRRYKAIFTQAPAEFRRRVENIDAHTEISVSPEDDIELRRVTLTNRSDAPRTIEVTSYAEVVLATPNQDLRTRPSAICSSRRNWCAIARPSSARAGRGRRRNDRPG